MSIDRVRSGSQWDNPQYRSNDYLKKKAAVCPEQPVPFSSSSITSLKPAMSAPQAIKQPEHLKKQKNVFNDIGNWIEDKWNDTKDWCEDTWDTIENWVSDKWNSFKDKIGVGNPKPIVSDRERKSKAKILDRHSPLDIEDDFKYLDISTMDPLRVMLAILVRQGELREEQAFLVQQKILLMQEDLKDLHNERNQIHAELALLSKRSGVLEKVEIGITVGQVAAGVVSTAAVVAGASAIATLGATAPVVVVIGSVAGILNGVVYGGKAINSWLTADTKEKMDKLQGEMLMRNARREDCQFQLKVDVRDMKKILSSLIGHAETGSTLLSAQYGK